MSLAMSKQEREEFLAETRVAIVSIPEEGRGPLTVPIWYSYEPGKEVRFVTGSSSRKAQLIRKAGRVSLCVQKETPPYRYVSVEGPATIVEGANVEAETRQLAYRYLGEERGELYMRHTAADRARANDMLVCMRPERWLTVDYRKWRPGQAEA